MRQPHHAVFNYRTEWNGVGSNIFNGSSEIGERDPMRVWVKINARTVQKQSLHLQTPRLLRCCRAAELDTYEIPCRPSHHAGYRQKAVVAPAVAESESA